MSVDRQQAAAAGSGNGRDRASNPPSPDCACSRAAARAAARPDGSSSCPDPAARSSSPCRTAPNRAHRTGCAGSRRCCRCRARQRGHYFGCRRSRRAAAGSAVSHSDSIRPPGKPMVCIAFAGLRVRRYGPRAARPAISSESRETTWSTFSTRSMRNYAPNAHSNC